MKKITIDIKFSVGDESFFIVEDEDKTTRELNKCDKCDSEHMHIYRKFKVVSSKIKHIAVMGQSQYGHDILIDQPYSVGYLTEMGWWLSDDNSFLSYVEAEQNLDNPSKRIN